VESTNYRPAMAPADAWQARVSDLAVAHERATKRVADAEAELSRANAELREIAERQIPELMDEMGLSTFTTRDGLVVEVKDKLRHSIPKDRRAEAHAWLIANGHGAVVKRDVLVRLGVESGDRADQARHLLEAAGFEPSTAEKVEPATMGALLDELLERGEDVPLELFGAWRQRLAKVVRK